MESDSSSMHQDSGNEEQPLEFEIQDELHEEQSQPAQPQESEIEVVEHVTEVVERHEPVYFSSGETFSSWQQFKDKLAKYEKDHFVNTCMRDSRTLESAKKRTPILLKDPNPELVYYAVKVSCIFSGKPKSRSKNIRKTKTFKQECPMFINLAVTRDAQQLIIRQMELTHNHILSEEVYLRMPHQRKLSDDVKKMAAAVLKMKGDKKLLRERLMEETGKVIYMKDIQNLNQRVRRVDDAEPVFVTPKAEPRTDEEDGGEVVESDVVDWLSTSRQTQGEDDQAVFAIKKQLAEKGDREDKAKRIELLQRTKGKREEFRRFLKGSRTVENAQCTQTDGASQAARLSEEASASEDQRIRVVSRKRRRRDDNFDEDDDEDEEMRREMKKLKVEQLRLQNYKTKLEILEMEMKLRVNHSNFTSDLLFQSGSK